ncbi:HAMP domain-containing histidine kinase [Enterococcus sp. BWT-B8]|uniref:sensor histidine kinase n=1 Tax=Enterococcus sp. BWT-B8 TaxID=2885157 RepID=UPI001E5D4C60|nr:HAMP domain-containing sensor histidine kinase [Enterococcus sp. BWT-B8]MCB5950895.1 HAMP domain-containing histidine kinase [Enterococcus sp. BWT-B8]
MFKKLRNKFLVLNILVTSIVMLTAFCVVYLTTYRNTQSEIEQKLNNVTGSFTVSESESPEDSGVDSSGKSVDEKRVTSFNKVTSDYAPSFILTVDKFGNILEINSLIDISGTQYAEAASIAWEENNDSAIVIAGRTWRYKIAPLQITHIQNGEQTRFESEEQFQILFLDVTDMQKNLSNLAITFLLVGMGMLAVIFVISIIYANRAIEPISESWEKQKQFIADASHELKTPLTTIMTNCDVLEANEDETIKSQKEWLGYIRIGTDRMSKLINRLLTLAKIEGMETKTEKQSFDISAMIHEVMQSMDAAAAIKNLRIERRIEFAGDIYGYVDFLRQVFIILYENAIKYTDESGSIEITVQRMRNRVSCTVKNTGKGISAKDLPHVFDRFYRSDTVRSNDENSYGLGLSIAKSIVEQIDGKITAKSMENEWTEFTFTFEI